MARCFTVIQTTEIIETQGNTGEQAKHDNAALINRHYSGKPTHPLGDFILQQRVQAAGAAGAHAGRRPPWASSAAVSLVPHVPSVQTFAAHGSVSGAIYLSRAMGGGLTSLRTAAPQTKANKVSTTAEGVCTSHLATRRYSGIDKHVRAASRTSRTATDGAVNNSKPLKLALFTVGTCWAAVNGESQLRCGHTRPGNLKGLSTSGIRSGSQLDEGCYMAHEGLCLFFVTHHVAATAGSVYNAKAPSLTSRQHQQGFFGVRQRQTATVKPGHLVMGRLSSNEAFVTGSGRRQAVTDLLGTGRRCAVGEVLGASAPATRRLESG